MISTFAYITIAKLERTQTRTQHDKGVTTNKKNVQLLKHSLCVDSTSVYWYRMGLNKSLSGHGRVPKMDDIVTLAQKVHLKF